MSLHAASHSTYAQAHACQTQLLFCKLEQAVAAALCATIADSNCAYDAALGICSNGRTDMLQQPALASLIPRMSALIP